MARQKSDDPCGKSYHDTLKSEPRIKNKIYPLTNLIRTFGKFDSDKLKRLGAKACKVCLWINKDKDVLSLTIGLRRFFLELHKTFKDVNVKQ